MHMLSTDFYRCKSSLIFNLANFHRILSDFQMSFRFMFSLPFVLHPP